MVSIKQGEKVAMKLLILMNIYQQGMQQTLVASSIEAKLQPLTKILRQIADLQEKLTFQAIWKVLNFSLEMTRLLKIEKWLEAWPLGCHPARNGHVTH